MSTAAETVDQEATLAQFAGFRLSRHEVDEDGDDNGITPGQWRSATCQEYEAAYRAHPLEGRSVYSSLTDPDGLHGRPQVFTEWGTKDGRTPIAAGIVLYSEDDRTEPIGCHHIVYVTAEHGPERCCDLHNQNCEPPSELCCRFCREVSHPLHTDGSACVLPTQPPSVALPDGWELHEDGHVYRSDFDASAPPVYAGRSGIEACGISLSLADARALAARLVEAAGIAEQLQAGAR